MRWRFNDTARVAEALIELGRLATGQTPGGRVTGRSGDDPQLVGAGSIALIQVTLGSGAEASAEEARDEKIIVLAGERPQARRDSSRSPRRDAGAGQARPARDETAQAAAAGLFQSGDGSSSTAARPAAGRVI